MWLKNVSSLLSKETTVLAFTTGSGRLFQVSITLCGKLFLRKLFVAMFEDFVWVSSGFTTLPELY